MRFNKRDRRRSVVTTLLLFSLATPIRANDWAPVVSEVTRSPVSDQALQPGGRLSGRVVNAMGQPVPGTRVTVHHEMDAVASTLTDDGGTFNFSGLRGGLHAVEAAGAVHLRRFWTAEAAPPAANLEAMLVTTHVTPESLEPEPEAPETPALEPTEDPAYMMPENAGQPWLTPYTATWVILGLGIGGFAAISDSDDNSAS